MYIKTEKIEYKSITIKYAEYNLGNYTCLLKILLLCFAMGLFTSYGYIC